MNEKSVGSRGLGAARCDRKQSEVAAGLLYERTGKRVTVEHYQRALINGMVVHVSEYARAERTCSSYVKMHDGSFCEVREIYVFWEHDERIALLRKRLITTSAGLGYATHIFRCDHPPAIEGLRIYLDEDVKSQVAFVAVEQHKYVCEQPNMWEKE